MSKPMFVDTPTARARDLLSREGRGSNSKSRTKLAHSLGVFLAIAALGGGSAYAATSSRTANPGTPTLLADVPSGGTPVTLTGKVTRVSISRHYLVIDSTGTPIIVTKRTSYRLIRSGLAGGLVGRTVHVRAIKLNGKLYAVALERLLGHLPRTL